MPARPGKDCDGCNDQQQDYRIETVEPSLEAGVAIPAFPKFHAHVRQAQAPGPRTNKCVQMETQLRHARYSGRQRYECAHHRQKSADKYRDATVTRKEAFRPIQFVATEQDIRAIFFDQRTASVITDGISNG